MSHKKCGMSRKYGGHRIKGKVKMRKKIRVSQQEADRLIEEALEPKIKDISHYPELEPDGPPIKLERVILRVGDDQQIERRWLCWMG